MSEKQPTYMRMLATSCMAQRTSSTSTWGRRGYGTGLGSQEEPMAASQTLTLTLACLPTSLTGTPTC